MVMQRGRHVLGQLGLQPVLHGQHTLRLRQTNLEVQGSHEMSAVHVACGAQKMLNRRQSSEEKLASHPCLCPLSGCR
jgi:hypothetical protein